MGGFSIFGRFLSISSGTTEKSEINDTSFESPDMWLLVDEIKLDMASSLEGPSFCIPSGSWDIEKNVKQLNGLWGNLILCVNGIRELVQ